MTRAERIENLLIQGATFSERDDSPYQLTAEILAVADDRTLVNTQGFADRIGRSHATLRSWRNRGQHEIPEPAGHWGPERVPYWDTEQVDAWAAGHVELIFPLTLRKHRNDPR